MCNLLKRLCPLHSTSSFTYTKPLVTTAALNPGWCRNLSLLPSKETLDLYVLLGGIMTEGHWHLEVSRSRGCRMPCSTGYSATQWRTVPLRTRAALLLGAWRNRTEVNFSMTSHGPLKMHYRNPTIQQIPLTSCRHAVKTNLTFPFRKVWKSM